jgi:probable O-glycosylation ligase (exosortase A-associated)
MRDIALFIVFFGILPVCFFRPWMGVLVFSWISYMNPHRLTWSVAYEYPFAKIVAIVTLIGFFLTNDKMRIPRTIETTLIVMLGFYFTATSFGAFNPEGAWFQWQKVIKILVMTIITMALINDRMKLKYLVMVIAFSIGFFGIKGGIFSIATGGGHIVFGPPQSFFADNNDLALALCMILPMLYYIAIDEENRRLRLVLWIAMGLNFIAIIFTYSRGGFLTLASIVFIFLLKMKKKVLAGIIASVALFVAFTYVPAQWFDRMETIQTYEEDPSAMGRINAWKTAWNLAKDRPLTGGGFETFIWPVFFRYSPDPNNVHDVHSIYFEIIGEHGFVAFGMFMALIILTLMTTHNINKVAAKNNNLKWAHSYANMFQMGLCAYMIGGLFLGRAYFDLFYHIVAMVMITKVLVQRELVGSETAISGMQSGLEPPSAKKIPTGNGSRTSHGQI